MKLEHRAAVVTGGGSGFGRACCRLLAREGAKIVAADLVAERVEETAGLIREEGGTCIPVQTDVSKKEDVDRLIGTAVETFGCLDILVNNAGILLQKGLLETTEEEWERVQAVNLKSMFLCSRRAIPEMLKAGKGKIVNMASMSAITTDPYHAAYASSKAGVVGFTQATALEFSRRGIAVNCVSPGAVRTNIAIPSDQMDYRGRMEGIPIGYMAEPEDIARIVLFLSSDDADYLVGENIVVDGGMSKNLYPVFGAFAMHQELLETESEKKEDEE